MLFEREFAEGVLRHEDWSLSDEQAALRASLARLVAKESPVERVREVEETADRFDHRLWATLAASGVATLAVDPDDGGDGAGLVELTIAAEQLARTGAAAPIAELAAVGRASASLSGTARSVLLGALRDWSAPVSIALRSADRATCQLVPFGAVAGSVVVASEQRLWLAEGTRAEVPANIASAPVAWWFLDAEGAVLAEGDAASRLYRCMVKEWHLLTAAALVGIAQVALDESIAYAKEREAFGARIGAYQAVSHRLADVATGVETARRLVWRAAWFADNDPAVAPELAPMAVAYTRRTAAQAVSVGIHVQGGLGVTVDSNMQLYYRRVHGWPALAGGLHDTLREIAATLRDRSAGDAGGAGRADALSDLGVRA